VIPFVVGAMLLQTVRTTPPPVAVPYGVGETMEYSGRYLLITAHGLMKVVGVDTVRGVPSWHFNVTFNVDAPFFHNKTDLNSWVGVKDFFSRRFTKVLDEKDLAKNDDFQIFPDSGFFRNKSDTTKRPTPHDPIDDAGFMYYLRTAKYVEHHTDTIPRYYRMNFNPVIIEVLGHEMVETPSGRYYCWILHPIVDEPHGMFDRDHDARIWITDDGLRIPVQIQSHYPVIGGVKLKLSKYTPGH